jgi:20S proteasome subunit beta 7
LLPCRADLHSLDDLDGRYQRRNKGDPLWNEVFVGGREAGRSFLGSVDMRGTSFVDNFMANGFALHVAIPILRRRWRPDMTQAEATTLLETCLTTQWYMHTKGYCRIQIAAVTDAGCTVSEPYEITQQWGYKGFENTAYCGLQKPLHS